MKVKNILLLIMIVSVAMMACEEDYENPSLSDSDLTIYRVGTGGNVKSEAWNGYDVEVGESMDLNFQVSPLEGTDFRWVLIDEDDQEELVSSTLSYTFEAVEEGSQRTYFIAERGSVSDTVVINFHAVVPGSYSSKLNLWQTIAFDDVQTGEFTFEYDMIASQDGIDAVTGLTNVGAVTQYSDMSAIVRFDRTGIIDAFDNTFYSHVDELTYTAGLTYHVRIDVDVFAKLYDVHVTDPDGTEFTIAEDFTFRNKSSNLTGFALVAGDYELENPGTHRVLNAHLESHSQNLKPSFEEILDQVYLQGTTNQLLVKATDPFGKDISLEVNNLPRFAKFEETGNGEGLLTFSPYGECGGCDLGVYNIEIIASSQADSNTKTVKISVIDAQLWKADIADVDVRYGSFAYDPPRPNTWTTDGTIIVGGGSNWEDPENDIYDMAGVFPFEIPQIEDGERFVFASFKATVKDISPWAIQNYDLYGIPYRPEFYVLGTDYYQGVYDGDANATAIQQKFADQTAAKGPISTSVAGETALVTYLNQQLDNGAKPGDFVFLRINVDVDDATTFGRIILWSADSGVGPEMIYAVQ
ncbi:MAG: hypothetical protein ABJH57_09575 [Cyclobacteriaceae bacterium]